MYITVYTAQRVRQNRVFLPTSEEGISPAGQSNRQRRQDVTYQRPFNGEGLVVLTSVQSARPPLQGAPWGAYDRLRLQQR